MNKIILALFLLASSICYANERVKTILISI